MPSPTILTLNNAESAGMIRDKINQNFSALTTFISQMGLIWCGTYSPATQYTKWDVVYYASALYIAKIPTIGLNPTNTSSWDFLLDWPVWPTGPSGSASIDYSNLPKRAPTFHFENMDSWWANWYWWATAVHDSTIKQLWTASIQMPCPTAWTSVGMRKNITDLDLSGDTWVEFWVRSDDWANVDAVEVLLWDTGFTNYWILDLKLKVSSETLENNVWHEFTFSKEDFPVWVGTINWATTQDMIVRARSIAGTTPNVWMDSFRFFEYPSITSGAVLFCADDGWNDQSNLLDIADANGQKVCLFIIPSAIGTPEYFTQGSIDDAHARGHVIAFHWATALTSLTWAALTAEIASIVAYRDAHPQYKGWHLFALPEGKINEEVKAALTPYFKYIFAIDEQKAYPYPNESLRTPRRSLLNTTSTAVAQGLMDTAMSGKGLQIINFHHIVATTAISTDYSIADTTTLFAYASTPANGINVGDWLSLFPDSGDTTAPTQTDELAKLEGGNTFTWNQTFDTNTLFVDATNNRVGFGTVSPSKRVSIDEGSVAANYNGWATLSQNSGANVGTTGYELNLLNSTQNVVAQFRWARTAASAYVGTEINSVSRDGFRIQTGSATAAEVFRIGNDWKITVNATNTAGWTTGNQTINKTSWTVNIAAAWTAVTVTNSLVTTSSIVLTNLRTNDATATIKNVVPWSGSFVINLWAAATAEVSIWFFVIN